MQSRVHGRNEILQDLCQVQNTVVTRSWTRIKQSAVHGSNAIFDEIYAKFNTRLGRKFGIQTKLL